MTTYDGIILGAGHNSLILQAYLARAGLSVVCLERRDVAGGGLSTVEDPRHPGFRHNVHSFFHRAVDRMPWYHELDLAALGAHYVQPDLNVALVLGNGEVLEWWTDFEKTFASFARRNRRDAETLRRWRDEFIPINRGILEHEGAAPPLPPELRREVLGRSALGRRLLDVSAWSPLEFVQREFTDPAIQAGLLFFNGLREVDLRAPGFGHHIPSLLASDGKAQLCLGGSAALARALVRAVESAGGEIRLNTVPRRILVEHGRAAGVETMAGEVIRARHFVASGLNPQQTFLELLEPGELPSAWRDRAAGYRYNLLAPLFALNLNLREPPRYTAEASHPELRNAFMVILGLDHVDQFADIVRHHEAGTIPPTVMWGACPTHFDPSQAPAGMHTAFMWEKLPYALQGDAARWDRYKETHARAMLARWTSFAPNLAEAVIDRFSRSPLDTERSLPNMREGDLLVGAFTNGQVGYNRPFAGAGHYRTLVPGLYLCGSSSHPGGNVTGMPGRNAAGVLLADLSLKRPWESSPLAKRFAALDG
ncbi:MAG: hypothetical protein JWM32_3072 [Verrucomicrobia bacterium]|nr:hypothetical protein [Verrucomicrobiota bacterium]